MEGKTPPVEVAKDIILLITAMRTRDDDLIEQTVKTVTDERSVMHLFMVFTGLAGTCADLADMVEKATGQDMISELGAQVAAYQGLQE